ncbi:MAG TPA: anti-sigma factor [Burkholderiales bacterium]|nr:anti-sigma factor [Burkholderiales bacterium]
MKIERNARLDALCGEYLLGTLRGAARRRFERALREEPLVALRLEYWQGVFAPRYTQMMELQPPAAGWKRLERELELERYRTPWYRRAAFWRGWALAATAVLALVVGIQLLPPAREAPLVAIAQLAGKADVARVTAALSKDGRTLELRAERAVVAGQAQSYELWLLPSEGGDPISLAVLGSLDARFALPPAHVGRLRKGAKLAVSVEPAGGSPTGKPTGPVILVGEINA